MLIDRFLKKSGEQGYIKIGKWAILWMRAQPEFGSGTAWAGGYYHPCTSGIDFPKDLFTDIPYVFYTKPDAELASFVGQTITKDACAPFLYNSYPETITHRINLDILVIGRWK